MNGLRDFKYLSQSRTDFPDFWISLMVLSMGFYLFLFEENYAKLRPMAHEEMVNVFNMDVVIFYYMISGALGLIRVLLPFKINIYLTTMIKCNILFCLIYELMMYIFIIPLPLISITYSVLVCSSLYSIIIQKS